MNKTRQTCFISLDEQPEVFISCESSERVYWFQASGIVRKDYDQKRKLLRLLESKGQSNDKIDKTRAVVKDLHSRIRVAIERIDSISKKIEELRDKELQPQLEELIEGYVLSPLP